MNISLDTLGGLGGAKKQMASFVVFLPSIFHVSCLFNDTKSGESGSLPSQGALLWLAWRWLKVHANHKML